MGGFAIYLGYNLISWSAFKQLTASSSSTKSESKALVDTVAELTWLEALLNKLAIATKFPKLCSDNLGATYMSANIVFHGHTKMFNLSPRMIKSQISSQSFSHLKRFVGWTSRDKRFVGWISGVKQLR